MLCALTLFEPNPTTPQNGKKRIFCGIRMYLSFNQHKSPKKLCNPHNILVELTLELTSKTLN
jgi:hypothetical protein